MRIVVTGANGFVGRPVCETFRKRGHQVTEASRSQIGEIGPLTEWAALLKDVDAVIHLAARVHQMNDTATDPLAAFREVNVQGTRRLAEQAAENGVRRFVFVSSVKVNGEGTLAGQAYTEEDPPHPEDPYGISKMEAEQVLRVIEARGGCETVILRPPLMYGAGVKANFRSLCKAIRKGVPLPFGCITHNRRSLLNVRNLADAIAMAVEHPGAAGETFLVSDGQPISTAELVRRIAARAGKNPQMLPIPVSVLKTLGTLSGRRAAVSRLTGSLVIDDRKIREKLHWTPPYTMEDGLKECFATLA